MSSYTYISAKLNYVDQATFDQATKPLRQHGWLRDDNSMIEEDGAAPFENVINGLTLTIPPGSYKNFEGQSDDLVDLASSGQLVEEATEDEIYIFVWKDGKEIDVNKDTLGDYLEVDIDKDLILMDEDEWLDEYEDQMDEFDDYYDLRTEAIFKAREKMESLVGIKE